MRTETGPGTEVPPQHKGTDSTVPESASDGKMAKEVGNCFKCPTNIFRQSNSWSLMVINTGVKIIM